MAAHSIPQRADRHRRAQRADAGHPRGLAGARGAL